MTGELCKRREAVRDWASGLMNPLAQARHGAIIHAERADRERDGPFRCPECSTALLLKAGEVRRHHFAHAADRGCRPNEKLLVRYAIELISNSLRLHLPERRFDHWPGRPLMQAAKDVRFDDVLPRDEASAASELRLFKAGSSLRVVLRTRRGRRSQPAFVAAQDGSSTLQIDLSRPPAGADELDRFILDDAPRLWLEHRLDAAWQAELQRRTPPVPVVQIQVRTIRLVKPPPQQRHSRTAAVPEHRLLSDSASPEERRAFVLELASAALGSRAEEWLRQPYKGGALSRIERAAHSEAAYREVCNHLYDIASVQPLRTLQSAART